MKRVNSPYTIRVIQAPEGDEHAGQRAAVFLAEGTDDERQKWLQSMELGDYQVVLEQTQESKSGTGPAR